MTNIEVLDPEVPSSTPGVVRFARNEAIVPGYMDSAITAAEEIRGAIQYVPAAAGSFDALTFTLKNAADSYVNYTPMLTTSGNPLYRKVLASSGNTTMTTAMSGSIMLLDGASVAYALPAIGASDVGCYFTFLVTSVATTQTITAQAADLLSGAVSIFDFDAAYTAPQGAYYKADEVDDLIITMNGTTKGGKIGSWLRLTAVSATRWFVEGNLYGDGVLATPFS